MSDVDRCRRSIRERGYGILPGIVSPAECDRALDLVHEWEQRAAGRGADALPYLARDSPIIWNLHFKDREFIELVLGKPAIEQVLRHFLNDPWYKALDDSEPNYILRGLVARSSADALPLHIDNFVPYEGHTVISMQAAVSLEGMTEASGATLVAPGSHLSGRYFDPAADAPTLVPIEVERGDVVFWDSRTWHGAEANRSGRTRWNVIATFTRWWIKQAFRTTERVPEEIYARLSNKEKAILGFSSIPYLDESEGIDMRRGHDALRPRVSDYREFRPHR